MLSVDCYYFYKLAVHVHPLTELSEEPPISQEWVKIYTAKEELLEFFRNFPLKTSRSPAETLLRAINAIVPDDIAQIKWSDANGEPAKIPFWHINEVKSAASEFESVLKAELSNWDTYFVSQKAAYSTAELIREAELMVPVPGRRLLSQLAISDYRQAGMCLAFNLGTAASFHVVRATETVIKQYYQALIGSLPGVKMRNWGAYHKTLSKCPDADAKVLGWLRHLTEEYRNPVLHPEITLSADEAIEFITACNALMTAIGRAMAALEAKNANGTGNGVPASLGEGSLSLQSGDAETA